LRQPPSDLRRSYACPNKLAHIETAGDRPEPSEGNNGSPRGTKPEGGGLQKPPGWQGPPQANRHQDAVSDGGSGRCARSRQPAQAPKMLQNAMRTLPITDDHQLRQMKCGLTDGTDGVAVVKKIAGTTMLQPVGIRIVAFTSSEIALMEMKDSNTEGDKEINDRVPDHQRAGDGNIGENRELRTRFEELHLEAHLPPGASREPASGDSVREVARRHGRHSQFDPCSVNICMHARADITAPQHETAEWQGNAGHPGASRFAVSKCLLCDRAASRIVRLADDTRHCQVVSNAPLPTLLGDFFVM